ncbi:flagellin N-terminal helical domain-containing protein [Pandoraea apista]|uniref:flagellin N-terminal helical domain-containing protein n=1 Tax=Pandoraea apista TaxID=93218 RepID=UPI0021ADB030|nr:flagellin [Pandoraea apista]
MNSNIASMRIQSALANTQQNLMTSMTRLGTGYRINSAADDAAGLQIATRLLTQSRGMEVASQNTQNAKSMLQTAEGSLTEMSNVLDRMKQLATQSADAGNGAGERAALQKEYSALGLELKHMMTSSAYGNEKLFSGATPGETGKLKSVLKFQVGTNADDVMNFDVSTELTALERALTGASAAYGPAKQPDAEVLGLEKYKAGGKDTDQVANDALVTKAKAKLSGGDLSGYKEKAAIDALKDPVQMAAARAANDALVAKVYADATGFTDIKTADGARAVLKQLDAAIDSVGNVRGAIGAGQNRLSHISVNLSNMMTSAKDSEGRLRDVDYASETANMTKLNILQQVGGSMLKQSGQMRQMVLSLLQQ